MAQGAGPVLLLPDPLRTSLLPPLAMLSAIPRLVSIQRNATGHVRCVTRSNRRQRRLTRYPQVMSGTMGP